MLLTSDIKEKRKENNSKLTILKSFLLLISFLVIFFLLLISAVEVEMKPEFASGETFLARISGNFVDQITRDKIFFYREPSHVAIPLVYDIVKIEDEFFIYALLSGKAEGDYSLTAEGVRYYRATEIVDDDIFLNFTISNKTALFSVNPGALITKGDFEVELQNLQDRKIILDIIEDSPWIISQSSVELRSGEKKKVFFSLAENAVKGTITLEFFSENASYIMPVYLDVNRTRSEKTDFEFQPSAFEVSLAIGSGSKNILYLANNGEEVIEDISFAISPTIEPYIVISPDKINSLEPDSREEIEIQIAALDEEAVLEGEITAYSGNFSSSLFLVLNFAEDFIPPENGSEEPVIVTTCEDLGGKICAENEACTGDSVYAKDGVCCLAECTEQEESSTLKWIGWGLVVLAFAFLYWFYRRRYRRVARRPPF